MGIKTGQLEGFEDLVIQKVNGTRYEIIDSKISKKIIFNLKGVERDYLKYSYQTSGLKRKFEKMNDYMYVPGYGFYLDGYAEFGITGSLCEGIYEIGKCEFEISDPSSLFNYLTCHEEYSNATHFETIKIRGVTIDDFTLEVEKAILYMATQFEEPDKIIEYSSYYYPTLMDFRELSQLYEYFDYSEISNDLDWSSVYLNNIALFNQGESSHYPDFFSYYRFMETFFKDGREEEELIRLVESIELDKILSFAKENDLIDANGTSKTLAKKLYRIRNNYVHHKLGRERIFNPTSNIPISLLSKWSVIAKEISIQLLNKCASL